MIRTLSRGTPCGRLPPPDLSARIFGETDNAAAARTARTEHREGWEFFLPRLAALLAPPEVSETAR
jgi:hypothetical protein